MYGGKKSYSYAEKKITGKNSPDYAINLELEYGLMDVVNLNVKCP